MKRALVLILISIFSAMSHGADIYISADIANQDNRGAIFKSSDGVTWTEVYSTGVFNGLNAMWAAGPNAIWAVGRNGTIAHYDGTSWSHRTFGGVQFEGVAGVDANNVWAVGTNQTIYRFDGTNWTRQFTNTNFSSTLSAVGMVNANTGWATDTGAIYQYDGSTWNAQGLSHSSILGAVIGFSPTDAWAAGGNGDIFKFNGTTWQLQPRQNNADYFTIEALSPTEMWVGGSKIWTDPVYGQEAAIMKYDGTSWTLQRSNVVTSLYDFAAVSSNEVWAVGAFGKIAKYDGSVWADVSPGNITAGTALTGIVVVPEPATKTLIATALSLLIGIRGFGKTRRIRGGSMTN